MYRCGLKSSALHHTLGKIAALAQTLQILTLDNSVALFLDGSAQSDSLGNLLPHVGAKVASLQQSAT